MKRIGTLLGVSAYREIQEEFIPDFIPPPQDIVQLLRDIYQFIQFPVFAPGQVVPNVLNFAGGRFVHEGRAFVIQQLVMTPKGDAVAAPSTDLSDIVLEHLVDLLDTQLGYRFGQSNKTKIYWSHVVIEFDSAVEQFIEEIGAIERVLTRHIQRDRPFKIKGFTFGTNTSAPPPPTADTIEILEASDFTIERRIDRPFQENRFFSTAPMRTSDHLQALADIEDAIRSG